MSDKTSSCGIGFVGCLTILFVALKLTHQIAWSWWWVLSPAWIALLIPITILIVCGIVYLFAHIMLKRIERKEKKLLIK